MSFSLLCLAEVSVFSRTVEKTHRVGLKPYRRPKLTINKTTAYDLPFIV